MRMREKGAAFSCRMGLVRSASKRGRSIRQLLPLLGNVRDTSIERARRVLGWRGRTRKLLSLQP